MSCDVSLCGVTLHQEFAFRLFLFVVLLLTNGELKVCIKGDMSGI